MALLNTRFGNSAADSAPKLNVRPPCEPRGAKRGAPSWRSTAIVTLYAVMTTAAIGAENPIHLKQAPGLDKVEANCTNCHSLDYVQMNSSFLNATGWNAEVAKMINGFGASISPTDAKIIVEYLTANYGVKD